MRAVFLDHLGARDVGGHQVGRELDAAELQREGVGQRADHQRLGQARHAHQQAMPAGEHGHQQFLDHLLLADDHPAELLGDQSVGFAQFLYGLKVVVFGHDGTSGCQFAVFSSVSFVPVRRGVPIAINSFSVAISSRPSATNRLPPAAPRAARSHDLSRLGGLLIEDIQLVARGPEDVVAGQQAAAVAGPLGAVGPDVLHPAAVFFPQADPVELASAGNQPLVRHAQQVDRVFHFGAGLPEHLAGGGVEGEDAGTVGRGDQERAVIQDTRIQIAPPVRRSLARSPCRARGYRLTHSGRPSSVATAATAPRFVL